VTGPPPATPPPTPAPPTGGGGSMLGMAPTPTPSGGSDKDNTGGLPTTNIVEVKTVPPPPPPPTPTQNPPPSVPEYVGKTEYFIVYNANDYRKIAGLTKSSVSYNFTTIANDITRYFKDYADFLKGAEEVKNYYVRNKIEFGGSHPNFNLLTTTKGAGKNPWHASAHIGFWENDPFDLYSGPLYQYGIQIR
jgi:hypothetical protein